MKCHKLKCIYIVNYNIVICIHIKIMINVSIYYRYTDLHNNNNIYNDEYNNTCEHCIRMHHLCDSMFVKILFV